MGFVNRRYERERNNDVAHIQATIGFMVASVRKSFLCNGCGFRKDVRKKKCERLESARVHIESLLGLYLVPHDVGRYFLHGRLLSSVSWREPGVM